MHFLRISNNVMVDRVFWTKYAAQETDGTRTLLCNDRAGTNNQMIFFLVQFKGE